MTDKARQYMPIGRLKSERRWPWRDFYAGRVT